MDSLLPSPSCIENIARMYNSNRYFTAKRNWVGQNLLVSKHMDYLSEGGVIKRSQSAYDKLNVYMLNRSMHQMNEACNKLWSTVELFFAMKYGNRLCTEFNENFLPSSTIPTLHYSNISALLSILSLFGLSSIARNVKRRMTFYNLVRASRNMIMRERNQYLVSVFGSAKTGWHRQVLQTYEGLSMKGMALPELDFKGCRKLLEERNRFDYDILGQTTMRDAYGIDRYFELLPIVVSSICAGLEVLHQVVKPIPNRCDVRFAELRRKLNKLTD